MQGTEQTDTIVLLDTDAQRLELLLRDRAMANHQYSSPLHDEIRKARIVKADELPNDVVTMHSTVTILDIEDEETLTYTLVYPWEADADNRKLSILAPVGTALIGYRTGDEIGWKVPGGVTRFRILSVSQDG